MKADPKANPAGYPRFFRCAFPALFGAFLGLTLLKFGNPPIMEKWVTPPGDFYEFLLGYPWPMTWSYWAFAVVCLFGVAAARWRFPNPRWILPWPLLWLGWQILASFHSVDARLTHLTLMHFVICLGCFYLGLIALPHVDRAWFWGALLLGFAAVMGFGFEQHFGGLEETRRYFMLYLYPKLSQFPPEYLKKLSSNRIFATLFYPNALAGALLLLLPPVAAAVMRTERMTFAAKSFLSGLIACAALGCLYWSGSKGGWLLMLVQAAILLLYLGIKRQIKIAVLLILILGGLAAFALKYGAFFQRGATSVVARFDYWRAALQTTGSNPVWGTGPGTFAIPYERIKRPESEMSRLVHNDYLEQASDSGIIGFVCYTVFIVGVLWLCRPHDLRNLSYFAVWLGVLGWSLQGLMEFSLYIPALAWPAFAFMGLLLATRPEAPASAA